MPDIEKLEQDVCFSFVRMKNITFLDTNCVHHDITDLGKKIAFSDHFY